MWEYKYYSINRFDPKVVQGISILIYYKWKKKYKNFSLSNFNYPIVVGIIESFKSIMWIIKVVTTSIIITLIIKT